jgi:hypothetical protein
MWRAAVLPRAPVALIALGPIGLLATAGVITLSGHDAGGRPYASYPWGAMFVIGYVWCGVAMWREQPAGRPTAPGRMAAA